jgi:hypothetical protein
MAPTQSSGNRFILVLFLCSALLLIAGYFTSALFLECSIQLLNGIGVTAPTIDEVFRHRLYFSAICAAIPWFLLLARKAGKAKNWKQYLFAGISMVLSGSIFWYLRIYNLRDYHAELASQGGSMQYIFDFNMLRFELHLAIGILIGGLLATVILHRFNRNLPTNPFRKNTNSKSAWRA